MMHHHHHAPTAIASHFDGSRLPMKSGLSYAREERRGVHFFALPEGEHRRALLGTPWIITNAKTGKSVVAWAEDYCGTRRIDLDRRTFKRVAGRKWRSMGLCRVYARRLKRGRRLK